LLQSYAQGAANLIWLLDGGHTTIFNIDDIPFALQELFLSQLKLFATSSGLSPQTRDTASVCVSECYVFGFGVAVSARDAVLWLLHATGLESPRAISWYSRVCEATNIIPVLNEYTIRSQEREEQLSKFPPELYLAARIRSQAQSLIQQTRETARYHKANNFLGPSYGRLVRVSIFNSREDDELSPLHFAALIGDDALVTDLQRSATECLSKQGRKAAHYACIGGHLSTLKILIQYDTRIDTADSHGVTPLHLCIFFAPEETESAVKLLLGNKAAPDAQTAKPIKWAYHDIELFGNPINWAIRTRNRLLVRSLLPHSPLQGCLEIAISNFFWEIVDDILHYLREKEMPLDRIWLNVVSRPFSHWIAHGRDHIIAIERTIQICNSYGILDSPVEDGTPLIRLAEKARVEDDFTLIESCLSITSPASLKRKDEDGGNLLQTALSRAKHQKIWRKTLLKIVEHYTVEELQEYVSFHESSVGTTYLGLVVSYDSIVGARVLLEKGVDVNQPALMGYGSTSLLYRNYTPLSFVESTDMHSLLVEFGANANTLQFQLRDHHRNFDLLELALTKNPKESDLKDLLHTTLDSVLRGKPQRRHSRRQAFRFLLGQGITTQYINCVDGAGYTLLHKAALSLDIDMVGLLLEAKADASIGSTFYGGISMPPLQVACFAGRSVWMHLTVEGRSEGKDIQARAFRVASELLRWHHAKADSLFEGVTLLHLASYMMIFEEVQMLIAAGYTREAKGRWPAIDHYVTPQELLDADFEVVDFDDGAVIALREQHNHDDSGELLLNPDFYDLLRLDFDFSDSDSCDFSQDWDLDYSTSRDFVLQHQDIELWNLPGLGADVLSTRNLMSPTILEVQQRLHSLFRFRD
jgi:ankyrin repeat protein